MTMLNRIYIYESCPEYAVFSIVTWPYSLGMLPEFSYADYINFMLWHI